MSEYILPTNRPRLSGGQRVKQTLLAGVAELWETARGIDVGRRKDAAYKRFYDYVQAIDPEDKCLNALDRARLGEKWELTPTQKKLLANLGGIQTPDLPPAEIFWEVTIAGIDDALKDRARQVEDGAARRADERIKQHEARAEEATAKAQEDAEKYRAKLAASESELADWRKRTEYLMSLVDVDEVTTSRNGDHSPPESEVFRRRSVEGHPGIYHSRTKDRKGDGYTERFEVKVGKNPWQSEDSLEEAIAKAAELRGESKSESEDAEPVATEPTGSRWPPTS